MGKEISVNSTNEDALEEGGGDTDILSMVAKTLAAAACPVLTAVPEVGITPSQY